MSFRPTVSVVIGGKIADIGYYRNWYSRDLFIEALALAVLYRDCRTIEEVRYRAFGTQKVDYIVEPEIFENTQEDLRWLEDCSEMPITVDLTRRAIYEGYSDISDQAVERKPDAGDIPQMTNADEDLYYRILSKYKINFDKIDLDAVEELFMRDDELTRHMSERTAKKIKDMRMEREGGPDDEAEIHRYRYQRFQKG